MAVPYYSDGTTSEFIIYTSDGTSNMPVGNLSTEQRILSRPVPVYWDGWESDTYKLQRAGWKLAVKQDIYYDSYELLMKNNSLKLTAVSSALEIHRTITDPMRGREYANEMPPFKIQHVTPNLEHQVPMTFGLRNVWDQFKMIDATPQMCETRIDRLEDSGVFAFAIDHEKEIVIDQADMSVVEHLQAIKDLQSEKQKELRDKARRSRDRSEVPITGEVVVKMVDYR